MECTNHLNFHCRRGYVLVSFLEGMSSSCVFCLDLPFEEDKYGILLCQLQKTVTVKTSQHL